ncbi:putative DNA helicase [Medicago truncatula]|uniref:Putative DNA helicase n=1 Tax=Medicago truncatula TaxID=3880 RepID=G7LJ14_MEDTR|nr:probable helicase CHR10 isoform X2 [Medicago truncatula]AET01694.1 hypothetical protein MTR_8g018930 [Medicago truncatula]RHN39379.1 putative DNA helicase [Medicago truncatula]
MCFGLHRRSRPAAFKFFTAGHSSSEIRKSVQNAPSVCQFDAGRSPTSLNNLVIQLRKVCNHPDLLESVFDGSYFYPPVNEIIGKCGKFQLVDRLLERLFARNHKVCFRVLCLCLSASFLWPSCYSSAPAFANLNYPPVILCLIWV